MWRRGIIPTRLFIAHSSTAPTSGCSSSNGSRSVFRRRQYAVFRWLPSSSSFSSSGAHTHSSRRTMTIDCDDKSSSLSSHSDDNDDENNNNATAPTIGSIYNPPAYVVEPKEVADSIRCSLAGAGGITPRAEASRDTGMSLVFLGTGAGLPTRGRCPSSTLMRLGGESFLVDAGEGVQRQLAFTRAKHSHIDRIFITHLHGDHIFGLPGLLLGLQQSQMRQSTEISTNSSKGSASSKHGRIRKKATQRIEERVVKIYGPPGLYNYIASNIILSCTLIHSLNMEVYELVGGRVRRAHGTREIRNPFEANYPEFNLGRLSRHRIACDPDGVWRIQDLPPMVTREAILSKTNPAAHRHSNTDASHPRFRIQAAEVDHLSGVATFGYTIQEAEPPRNINATKAQELGVSPTTRGHKYSLLKAGFSVWTDDGTTEIQPRQVWMPRRKRARKIAVVGDNRGWTPSMKRIAQDSDVLVHEATLMDTDSSDWRKRGHSTAGMAGKVSGQVNAKLLVLHHISAKADYIVANQEQDGHSSSSSGRGSAQLSLIQQAKEASNQISNVIVAYDFMELLVPWLGFGSVQPDDENEEEDAASTDSVSASNSEVDGTSVGTVLEGWFGPKN